MTEQKLAGGIQVLPAKEVPAHISALIWGPSGAGKTTLAATLPGRKLLINFDPNGPASIAFRDDVVVADYSSINTDPTPYFKQSSDPMGLKSVVDTFDSVIVDSLTTVGEYATAQGIRLTKGATIERPSPGAYGARNALVLQLVTNMLKFCNAHEKHVAFTAHEGAPKSDEEGTLVSLPMYLGGQLPSQTSLRFSEVWALYDLGSPPRKTIGIRPCRLRSPMKSRMFDVSKQSEFTWNYDPSTDEGDTIEGWHTKWLAGGRKKISPPK